MKMLAILGASAVAAFGQSVAVTVAATSPTQAVLTYTAPVNSACTVEMSESSTYSPLVHDVDGSLFAGANLDNRAGSINSAGNLRIFVAGTRAIQKASDSNNYSRALQQGTQHYFRVTCGSAVATGTFTTKVLPMGTTYSDLIPLDSNGNYLFPSVTQTRNTKLIDPQTGVLMTLVNVPSDNTADSAPWPSAGGFGRYANDLLDAQGNYHVLFNDSPGGVFPSLYSINPTTGAANYLGAAFFYQQTMTPASSGGVTGVAGGTDTVMFDATDPNTIYVGVSLNTTPVRSTIAKWTYTGNDTPLPGFTFAPATVVDLLGGQDLTTLAHAFNPALSTSAWVCGPVQLQSHYFTLRCTGIGGVIQNVYAWEGAYDIGNGLPLGSGGNGHMIALVQGWALPGSRWCGDHTSEYLGSVPVLSFAVHSLTGLSSPPYDHGGPYSSTLVGNIDSTATTITITSTYPSGIGSPPAGYATGEPVSPNPDYFLMSAAVGDTFWIDSETFQIIAKNSPARWTVARGVASTPAVSHSSGAAVSMACQNALTLENSTGGYVWWDFVNNPDGTNTSEWVMNFGNHPVSRGNFRVDSGYPYRPGAVTNESTWGVNPAFSVTPHPIFSNSSAPGDGNSYQKHPSMASGAATTFFDQTYFVGTSLFSAQNFTATTPITGSLYQYHYETGVAYQNGTLLTPKYFPTLTKTAGHAFVDVSGPGSVLTGNPVDNYKYCIANAANECVAGSAIGNVFFNHPSLSAADPWCTGGENGIGATDICIGNFASIGLASIQFGIANDNIGNLTYRPLTRVFETYEGNIGPNLKLTYGGEFAFMIQLLNSNPPAYSSNVWAIHVPPVPTSDRIDRGTFVPAVVTLTAPTGLGVAAARVKFWYAEQGGSLSAPYCTSRREACVTTASTINQANPFRYAATEAYVPAPCAVSCTITIPVYPLHSAYYSAEFLDSTGSVVSTTQGIAVENVVVAGNFTMTTTPKGTAFRGPVTMAGPGTRTYASQAFTSVQSGNWNDPATWGARGLALCHATIPCMTDRNGAGDTVLLGNLTHTVTCPVSVSCSAGSSPGSDTGAVAIAAVSYGANASLVVNGTLTIAGPVRMPNATWTNNGTIVIDASWSGAPLTAAYSWATNNVSNSVTGGRFVNRGLVTGAGNSYGTSTCDANACRSGLFGIDDAMSLNYFDQGVIDCIGGKFQNVGYPANAFGSVYENVHAASRTISGCTFDSLQTIMINEGSRSVPFIWTGTKVTNTLNSNANQGVLTWVSTSTPAAPCTFSNSTFAGPIFYYGGASSAANLNCTWTNVAMESGSPGVYLGWEGNSYSTGATDQILWYVQNSADVGGQVPANGVQSRWVLAQYANSGENNNNLHPLNVQPGVGPTTLTNWFTEGNNLSGNSDFLEFVGGAGPVEVSHVVQTCNQFGQPIGSFINVDPGGTQTTLVVNVDSNTVCSATANPSLDESVMGVGAEATTFVAGSIPHIYSSIFYEDTNTAGTTVAICGFTTASPPGAIGTVGYNAYYNTGANSPYCALGIAASVTAFTANTTIAANRGPNWLAGNRRLINFDQYLGYPVSPNIWAPGQTYTNGDVVSDSQSGVYGGASFNWRFINQPSCTALSSSANRPLTGTAWNQCWEPAAMQYIRAAVLAGTIYSFAPTGATGLGVIGLLNAWAMYGYSPVGEGSVIASGGFGGTYIGAVAPQP